MANQKITRLHSTKSTPQVLPARGQRWRHKRFGIEGVIVGITHQLDPKVIVDIPDDLGMMTWKSTVRMFVERWSFVGDKP